MQWLPGIRLENLSDEANLRCRDGVALQQYFTALGGRGCEIRHTATEQYSDLKEHNDLAKLLSSIIENGRQSNLPLRTRKARLSIINPSNSRRDSVWTDLRQATWLLST